VTNSGTKISESAEKIDRKDIEVLDVTEEYIDVEARIETKKELEKRYKELLAKAKTVEDILKIEKEIGVLRAEIESIEGRLRYLKDRIGFSTLTVEFYQTKPSAFGFSSKFTQALAKGWDLVLLIFVGLTHLWALIILALIIVVFIRRYNKKKQKTDSGDS
jgi:hypothetical protein